MKRTLETWVRRRANDACEYCWLPQKHSWAPFEIDHVVAQQHGGKTTMNNLALACFACNHHKGPNLSGIDPKTRKVARLFHPRRDNWHRHFRWRNAQLIGKTAIGRATIRVLGINLPHRLQQRAELILEGVFPP